MSWWDSIDTVTRFNNWMQFAVIVFALLTTISGFLVWLSGNRISLQQTKSAALAQQKVNTYENTSLSVHKELVTLQQKQFETEQLLKVANTSLVRLRKQLEENQKKRLEAQQALTLLKADREPVSQKIEIMPVSPEKKSSFSKFEERFLNILKQGSEGIIDIYAVQGDSNSKELASDFDKLFKKAGWTTNGVAEGTFSKKIKGLVLAFHSKDTTPSYAPFLLDAFSKLDISVSTRINSKYPEWSLSLIVSDISVRASTIRQNSP